MDRGRMLMLLTGVLAAEEALVFLQLQVEMEIHPVLLHHKDSAVGRVLVMVLVAVVAGLVKLAIQTSVAMAVMVLHQQ